MHGKFFALGVVAMALFTTWVGAATRAKAPVGEPRLGEPEGLSPMARHAIHVKMANHGRDASDLMMAVTLLQFDRVHDLSVRLAEEPALSRPVSGGADELASSLPEGFFRHQDGIRKEALKLAELSSSRRPREVSEQFGKMVQMCVGCHAEYLNARTPPR